MLLKNLERFSDHEVAGHPVILGYRLQILSLDDLIQQWDELEEYLCAACNIDWHVDGHCFAIIIP